MPALLPGPDLPLHVATLAAVSDYINRPAHAIMITGPAGSGKATLAGYVAGAVLSIELADSETLNNHPYLRIIRSDDTKVTRTIPIESIRGLQQFLSLRVPGPADETIRRAVIIEDAQHMTTEAQNALLKTLEEPPVDTVIILTGVSNQAVLPTIQSRVRQLAVLPPPASSLVAYFESKGYGRSDIDKALLLSGELPGLASALLEQATDHPLATATGRARELLQQTSYQRLLAVDELSKQRQLSQDIAYVLGQMSRMALLRTSDQKAATRWQKIMTASFATSEQLAGNTQSKLVLTNLMLQL